jgi:hypothetical protein
MASMGSYPKAAMERAMKLQDVMLQAMAKKITWWQAAEILGISDRHMRHLNGLRAGRGWKRQTSNESEMALQNRSGSRQMKNFSLWTKRQTESIVEALLKSKRRFQLIPPLSSRLAYASWRELRIWCQENRNRFYIPEWLLAEWHITVGATSSGAA